MKCFSFRISLLLAILTLMAGCGIQVKETFTINPDMTGKCLVEAKMVVDTTRLDANLSLKDSLYGIETPYPNYHKMKFSRKDAMAFALRFIKTKGVEVWYNIHYGMSKKRDAIYFRGTAYFRNISHLHFTAFDSMMTVSNSDNAQITLRVDGKPAGAAPKMLSDDELDKKAKLYRENAFYIRPVLADVLNPAEETVMFQLPADISSSSIFGEEGKRIVQLTLTGNDILKYADSVVKSTYLEERHYRVTGGTNKGAIQDLFNSMVYGADEPVQVTWKKGGNDLFNYSTEVQTAIVYFDDFMQHSGLEKYDSTQMIKEEKLEMKASEENGVFIVNKSDSEAHKPYFTSLTASQSGDTLQFDGELSEDIKANADGKLHIMKLIAGQDMDITDSIQGHNKLSAELVPAKGDNNNAPKHNVKFLFVVHFPPGCKEVSVQGRVSTNVAQKPGLQLAFKIKQIKIVTPVKK